MRLARGSALSNVTLKCPLLSRFQSPNRAEVAAVRGEVRVEPCVCVLSTEVTECDNVPSQLSVDPE